MRKLHEKRKRPLTWRLAWKREQAETPQKKYARICLSDLLGQTHTDILLRLRRYRQPFVAHSWVASGWLYITIPLSTKWKRDRGNRLKAWKAEAPQKKCVRICLSDLLGQTHTDILLRLRRYGQPFVAHSWVASGWLYLSQFRFQQGTEGASGKGGCAVRKIIRTSIVKPSVWCGYADFLSAMPPVPMTDPYHVRVNHQHGFTCAKKNDKKRKRQDPVKVPLSHSHERVVRLPIV